MAKAATQLAVVRSEFDIIPAFTLDEGAGRVLKVSVTFQRDDYSKPLDLTFSDPDRDAMVSVDWDIWKRVIAAVERAADQ